MKRITVAALAACACAPAWAQDPLVTEQSDELANPLGQILQADTDEDLTLQLSGITDAHVTLAGRRDIPNGRCARRSTARSPSGSISPNTVARRTSPCCRKNRPACSTRRRSTP